MSKAKFLSIVLTPPMVFLGSFAALVWFFSQQSGNIWWENLVASAIFAAVVAFFAFICMFSRWVFVGWLGGTIFFILLAYLLGMESFSIDYFRGNSYTGSCPVSFYCLNQHAPTWLVLLIQIPFETILLFDIIVGFKLGFLTLLALNNKYPQTKYFIGTFILGLFTFLLSFVQKIPDVPQYNGFQYAVLVLLGLFALVSLCFGIFYKKLGTRVDKFKRIYGAAVLSFIPLLTILIPFDVSTAEAQKEAFIFRLAFAAIALFSFIYIGFFAKFVPIGPKKIIKS